MKNMKFGHKGFVKFLAFGCLGVIAFVAILAFLGYRYMIGMVEDYTETEPRPLPSVTYTEEQSEEVQQRVATFESSFNDSGESVMKEPLVLSGQDLNILLHTRMPEYAQYVYLDIDGDTLKGQVSLPLEQFSDLFAGRYLNGAATFTAVIDNGKLDVRVNELDVGAEPIPAEVQQKLTAENLAAEINNNPEIAEVLAKIDWMTIEGGRVILTPR